MFLQLWAGHQPLETSISFALSLEGSSKGADRREMTTVSIVTRNALQSGSLFTPPPPPSRMQDDEQRHLALCRNLGNLKERQAVGVKSSMCLNGPHSCASAGKSVTRQTPHASSGASNRVCFIRNGKSLNSDSPVFSSPRLVQRRCRQFPTNCNCITLHWPGLLPAFL
ncbi:hypothetical protein LY76DRAFT_184623 [Colletotrichum caudatum]|nr:hypothetical protein LY76DRAFT_184623 [Colletotrichum caudatum]